jgi:hypothetical protein
MFFLDDSLLSMPAITSCRWRVKLGELLGLMTALLCATKAHAGMPGGIGVLGDSYSDEYRFYPRDRTTARNWVEILAETRELNFGRLTTEHRGEPQNQGYEFNWARSDATTADLIATGQHTGLAAQVACSEITVVVIFIGGNDFINALVSDNPTAVLELVLARASANLQLALDTILKASPSAQVLLATSPNILELPEFAAPLRARCLSPLGIGRAQRPRGGSRRRALSCPSRRTAGSGR